MFWVPAIGTKLWEGYRDLSIRLKIALILLIAIFFAFVVAGCAVLIYETKSFEPRSLSQLENQTEILTEVLIPSLQFQDNASASEYLATLRHWNSIQAAAVYDVKGKLFAEYRDSSNLQKVIEPTAPPLGHTFFAKSLTFSTQMKNRKGEIVGYLWLNQGLMPLYARLPQYGIMFIVLMLSIGVVTASVALALKQSVLRPILSLSGTAQSVVAYENYRLRAIETGHDEIGDLTRVFNHMLEKIEQRDHSLRQSEERFSKAFSASPFPIIIARAADMMIVEVNNSCLALLGLNREETLGHSISELGFVSEATLNQFLAQLMSQNSIHKLEAPILTKAGTQKEVLVSIEKISIHDEDCFLATLDDVTERKQTEANLRQSQKMEAIGLLAGGIAHDFNNLLTAIIGYSSMALDGLEESHRLARPLNQILLAGERAEGLTRQLLAYSRKQVVEFKIWNLNQVMGDMDQMLRRLIQADIELVFRPTQESCLALVDRGQVEQVILNLAVNARDAMPDGGRLILETSVEVLEKSFDSHLEIKPGTYAVISVSDTGMGMSPDVKARLFEPFFTTKEVGKGTGLGLAVVYGVVQHCGGTLSVYSEPGLGTTFRIYFPSGLAEAVEDAKAQSSPHISAYRGNDTILLVEDENLVREFSEVTLTNLGYTVLVAANGMDGLHLYENNEKSIDLVITDLVMPNMGGQELADKIREKNSNLPVLFVSGYSDDGFRQKGGLKVGDPFLQKPFTSIGLAHAARKQLDNKVNTLKTGEVPHDQNPAG